MRERGIIMQAESVRAILAGRKTQTRRVVKPQPYEGAEPIGRCVSHFSGSKSGLGWAFRIPDKSLMGQACWSPHAPGGRLWVREAWTRWCSDEGCDKRGHIAYRADASAEVERVTSWRSPLYMPRWASRLTLEITEVHVQRVQEITHDDAVAEGVAGICTGHALNGNALVLLDPIAGYRAGWDAINAKRGFPWASNPWVWAVTFKRVEGA